MLPPEKISNWIEHVVKRNKCTRCGLKLPHNGIVYLKREGDIMYAMPPHFKRCNE